MGCIDLCPGSAQERNVTTRCNTGIVLDNLTQEMFNLQPLLEGDLAELAREEIEATAAALDALIDQCPFKQRIDVLSTSCEETMERRGSRRGFNLNVTSREIMTLATSAGMSIQPGSRHRMLVAEDGSKFALPDHPGTLSRGVAYSAYRWLQTQDAL